MKNERRADVKKVAAYLVIFHTQFPRPAEPIRTATAVRVRGHQLLTALVPICINLTGLLHPLAVVPIMKIVAN